MSGYKGYSYTIKWCEPKDGLEGWGEKTGLFYVDSDFKCNEFYPTYGNAKKAIEGIINEFVRAIPQNTKQWILAIEDCVIQDGYEDWHISEEKALHILDIASKYYKKEGAGG